MPINSIAEARDEILDHFKVAWDSQGTPPLVLYDDKRVDLPDDAPYARVVIQHNTFGHSTIGGKVSQGGGGARYSRSGVVTVQIFTLGGDGLTQADILVDFTLDIFEGADTGSDRIEFRNVRSNEIGETGPWFQTNVIAEFEYDRIR